MVINWYKRYVCQLMAQSLVLWICVVDVVFGYYCDHNYCVHSSQYCCGDNQCCDYVNQTVFNSIVIIISLIIMSSILWLIFRIFCFNSTMIVIKKIGQKFIVKPTNRVIDQKRWLEDPESSLLTDELEVRHGSNTRHDR
ncbi:uncharacterized protein LOC128963770 [Oppia nitens]|uniref:uncharacterized protein LOC128963770 n=1 Tax=Oppia nitens TaxID=1686743 RepID=UPI0023DC0FCE|nr:uncharacterized protein LOC128963770 [Oppia nitens]